MTNPILYCMDIIETLTREGYFKKDTIMDPVILYQELVKASEKKVDLTGMAILSEDEIVACYDKAASRIIDECIQSLMDKGEVRIAGVDPNGELLYEATKPKDSIEQAVTAHFEQFLPDGPKVSLN